MKYRTLGRTGLKVSQLGFGAMRLPMKDGTIIRDLAIPMIHRAFEGGVNYIDTAVGYCNGDSQRVVGEALKGWRDRIVVSTKNHNYGDEYDQWRRNLDDSLERLQVDSIDIYNTHGVNWKRYTEAVEPRVGTWLQKAKDEGLIRHICTSFHDNNEGLVKLVDAGFYDSITLQYNMLDRQLEEGIAHAKENNIGIVVMGPVAGGRLGVDSEVLQGLIEGVDRVPELALRFVLANSNVSVALSGMSTIEQVEENLAVCDAEIGLTDSDRAALDEHLARLKSMSDLYCSGCGYCTPCPQDVKIPQVFQRYNEARVYGLWEHARTSYAHLVGKGHGADNCTECGQCLEKCPQNIAIPERLSESHDALTRSE